MDISQALAEILNHPRILSAGMVLTHYGMVRSFDLQRREVLSLTVEPDRERAEIIRRQLLTRPGIVEIVIRLNSGKLKPGDPIMLVAVAGETRDQVFPIMQELIERLKKEASRKIEETV